MEVKNKIMNCLNFTNNLAGVLIILKRKKKGMMIMKNTMSEVTCKRYR